MKSITVSLALFTLLFLGGCVTKQTHEATLAQLQSTTNSLETTQDKLARSQAEIRALEEKKNTLQQELYDTRFNLEATQLDLSARQAQIETLKQIEDETKRRNAIYASFVEKLKGMIDGGRLTVSIENGRIVINLPENVLFASGSAKLNDEGRTAIKEIANVLSSFSDRRFQVEGHTDNMPIKSQNGYSNWELSSERALSVVHLMSDSGVMPANLSAAGFGEFQPRADNSTSEGRMLNRRIEIVMLPNLDILSNELPKVTP
jgi:chemotaxis protein MotB